MKGDGGAQANLLEEVKDEAWVYLRLHSKNGYRYGGMARGELVQFAYVNYHAYEPIPTSRKKKIYLEFDHEVPDAGRTPRRHQAAFKALLKEEQFFDYLMLWRQINTHE